MRYTLAVILMVVGVVVGGLGILQKTLWAPDDQITATAEIDAETPAVVVDPGMLNLYETPATLKVEGSGDLTIAQAPAENVEAWVGDSASAHVTGLAPEGELTVKAQDGKAKVPNPAGADLWTSEVTGTDTVELDWTDDANRTGFLIAGSGEPGDVKTVTISWPNHAETPWALPLMIIGGALFIGGIVILFFNRKSAKKEKNRRTARQERRKKLAEYGTAFAIVPVLALSACGPEELPKPEPSEAPSSAAAGVNDDQAKRILDSVAEDIKAADKKTSSSDLKKRAAGPALQQREDAYKVKEKVEKQKLPPAVANEKVVVNYTAATDSWPRMTSLITSAGNDTQLLVLTQEDPRSDYKLWSQTQLVPGTELPEIPDARQGSAPLDPKSKDYALTPEKAVSDYAKALGSGKDSKEAKKFESDDFSKSIWKNQQAQKQSAEEGKAEVTYKYTPGKEIVAQGTADDSAVVTGVIEAESTISPESVDGRTGTLTLSSPQKELTGSDSTQKPVTTKTTQVLTFLVPKDGKVRLIGGLETLSGAELE
ncbi:MAG: hypothetical protein ACTMKZ_02890 [Brevibacterium aurantiacum]|uniref:Uncharacterized protein n=2 Tax=Brevibacterium aurantiacum TaxID=273384 RepID=A0A2A3ZB94_BREAU|nr:hypothetical protein [Brevibacterium aurantiacum]MDN5593565.1 hypothetical protein [Brevibacterium sp.]AZL06448.1 hypothetical protein CXR24_13285 [Brevibacterium aurantiacum]AZL10003.1 hypothetical protein CXR26_12800 [Brevibacterium aurantiacum]AZT97975.1 hypothetical protein CXR27_13920 [Brevibacterium aurantiacum]MDN5606619.1 hypothetical protein [Brevibacterium sp.]